MSRAQDVDAARREFDCTVADLTGRRVLAVEYWDIHNFGDEPRRWDYEDWHHAVMGVELTTDAGPRSILWTDTFYPYGVEVFAHPMHEYLRVGPDGPEKWAVGEHPLWQQRIDQHVQAASALWARIDVGAGHLSDGTVVSPSQSHVLPVALRLDFPASPVWFVAGIPGYPDAKQTFVPGDEIMVVFSAAQMREIGFSDGDFLRSSSS